MRILFISLLLVSSLSLFSQMVPEKIKKKDTVVSSTVSTQTINTVTRDSMTGNRLNPIPGELTGVQSSALPTKTSLMSTYEFGLSIGVLGFGILLILLEIYLIKSKKINEELLVRFILITLIITATLFLITAGYDNNQIAPAIELFGTVA